MTENATVSHSHTHALEATGLKKHYGPRNVVKGVSLAVKSGEVVGLLGKNGAGKTTTFYMVVGLVVADDGQIRLDGQDITHMPIYKRARMGLSYLPQEASVFRKLSVEDNVRAILELQEGEDGKPLSKDVIEERLDQLLEELQIQHLRTNQAISLSGGERRRTEIARALAANPRFILLDEPFAGVDPIAVIEIQRIVRFLKERNIGVLITDHNVRETLSICDHAYIINEGEVLASGTPDELVNDQAVRKIYLGETSGCSQMENHLLATLSQQQVLSQEQQQSLRILQMPTQELLGEIELMLESNPLLEVEEPAQASDDPQARAQEHDDDRRDDRGEDDSEFDAAQAETPVDQPYEAWQGASSDEAPFERIPAPESFRDELLADLGCLPLTPRQHLLVACLVEELDDRGFFTSPFETLMRYYARILKEEGVENVTAAEWREALATLQSMDPPGIGTAGPGEALMKQIERIEPSIMHAAALETLKRIVSKHLDKVAADNRPALLKLANGKSSILDEALRVLKTLSPYPIARESSTLYIVPDVIVRTQNGVSTAHLNGSSQLRLRLRINDASSEADPSTRRVLLGEAKTFIQRIEARRATLQRLADAIVTRQQAYFEHGPAALRPMTLSQIAEELGLSVPTVSRAVSGKFIACSQGTVEMRSLFSAVSFSNQGSGAEEQGASEIQAMICKLIETEDPRAPLSDEMLCEMLQKQGVPIARRTVAKYRTCAGIPSARSRRRL